MDDNMKILGAAICMFLLSIYIRLGSILKELRKK